jgi:hypothetical protein
MKIKIFIYICAVIKYIFKRSEYKKNNFQTNVIFVGSFGVIRRIVKLIFRFVAFLPFVFKLKCKL